MQLERVQQDADVTIGALACDGAFVCWVCEDAVREVPGQPVEAWKVPGKTAIPTGHYRIEVTMSARFKRLLPILVAVPGFEGVRIHPGTSGIFQIIRIGPRTAEFSFRAWTTGQSNPRLQTVHVEAGPDGNVELAIIRRMIQLIREHYKEDFNWESHRLHRVVVLSAREKDTAGLEEFLMREFFINPVR